MHLPNVFEDSTNSKLFGCASDGVYQGVLLSINHGVLLRVQQVLLLVLLNLCLSIIKIVTLAHILSWFEYQCSLDAFLFGLQGNLSFHGSKFKPFVVPHMVTFMMLLLFHCFYFSIGDPPNVFVVPLLLLLNY